VIARVIVSELADADTKDILAEIEREAGCSIAAKYNARFEKLYDRLAEHPESCEAHPELGAHIRVGVITPYLVIYHYNGTARVVRVIRVLHGRRRVTSGLLHGN
jgi:toxin ParE1/3/4